MYRFFAYTWRDNRVVEGVGALAVSLAIAEVFYKFHSFTLECLAFLATWFIVDAAVAGVRALYRGRGGNTRTDNR